MKMRCLAVIMLLGVVLLVGCVESASYKGYRDEIDAWPWWKPPAVSLKDWLLDATDVAALEVGGGECIGVTVMPTELMQVGFFFGNTMKLGFRDRSLGYYRESRHEGGFSWYYYRDMRMEPIMGTSSLGDEAYRAQLIQGFPLRDNKDWHWMDLGGEVGLIFFNASAHVSPKQTLDFAISTVALPFELTLGPILSACGVRMPEIDMCDDDTVAQIRRKHAAELIEQPQGFQPIEYFFERSDPGY